MSLINLDESRSGNRCFHAQAPCPNCAQHNEDRALPNVTEHNTPAFISLCKHKKMRGLGLALEGLKIRRASALGGSIPPPGTMIPKEL